MLLSEILTIGAIIAFVIAVISLVVFVVTKYISRMIKAAITIGVSLMLMFALFVSAIVTSDREFINSFDEGSYIVDVDKTIVTCETNEADELALILKNKGVNKCDIHKDVANNRKLKCTIDGNIIYYMDFSVARTMLSYKTMVKE